MLRVVHIARKRDAGTSIELTHDLKSVIHEHSYNKHAQTQGMGRRLFVAACPNRRGIVIRLTAYTNYALRTLMYCALHPDRVVRMEDVADAYGISKAHLMKAARQLGQLGYLENHRGRSGGVRLAMPPGKIVIGEVVRHTDGDMDLVECFNTTTNTCPIIGACKLTALFRSGLRAFLAELDKVTLEDMVSDRRKLLGRLADFAER